MVEHERPLARKVKLEGSVVTVKLLGVTAPVVEVNVRLVIVVEPAPKAVTVPESTAEFDVIDVAGFVTTVGAPAGHGSVLNESVAPVPVAEPLLVARAANV